jgi:hypothetical protein
MVVNIRRDVAGFILACGFVAATLAHAAFCLYLHHHYGIATLVLGALFSQQSMTIAFLFCWQYIDKTFENRDPEEEAEEESCGWRSAVPDDALRVIPFTEAGSRDPDSVGKPLDNPSTCERVDTYSPDSRSFTLLSFTARRPFDQSERP